MITSTPWGSLQIPHAALQPQKEQSWANYALGLASQLKSAGVPINSFSARVDGNLPAGCGLASSAALEVATAFCLLKLCERQLPPLQIAKLCQKAEHEFVGVQSGLLDQVCSIFGRADHAIFFDTRSEEVRTIRFPPGLELVVAESGHKRELADGRYNDRRRETRAAAEALAVPALRDASESTLENSNLPPLLRRRLTHIVGENDRVRLALELLAAGHGIGFGRLMTQSHESSRRNLENSSPELDLLVDIARKLPGVLGARLTRGGFGGATVTLCEAGRAAEIGEELARQYAIRTKIHREFSSAKSRMARVSRYGLALSILRERFTVERGVRCDSP